MTNHLREMLSITSEFSTPELQGRLIRKGYSPQLPTYLDLIEELGIHRDELRQTYPKLEKGTFRRAADRIHQVKGVNAPTIEQVVSLKDTELQSSFNGVGSGMIEAWNILIKLYLDHHATRE